MNTAPAATGGDVAVELRNIPIELVVPFPHSWQVDG